MSGKHFSTVLDPGTVTAETRAAAIRVLTRLGATDLIEALGLDGFTLDPNTCPTCGRRRELDGRPCRRKSCVPGGVR